jgi:hypothetical protein
MLKSTEGYSNIMKSQLIIPISNQTGPETGCPFTKAKFVQEGIFFVSTPIICLMNVINKKVGNQKN